MIDLKHDDVKVEYRRWSKKIGYVDLYLGKYTIGIHEVLQAHFLLIDFFQDIGEGVGGVGPKSLNLLHSALSRQFVQFGGKSKWNDRILICASLMYGLIKNHPFHDANKRTAFLVALLHLQKIGRTPRISHTEFEDFTVRISDDTLSYYEDYETIDVDDPDRDVRYIARFLKKATRDIDLRIKRITFNELKGILAKKGMTLENPKGNHIDVMSVNSETGKKSRICHIGFHGWTREVSRRDIDILREASKLDARHGYDAQAFFNGLDDPLTLIKKYEEPLRRLAFR